MPWLIRLRNLFRIGPLDAEIDEELRFHIDSRIADHIAAGMSPGEARRQAIRAFGGRLQAREASRDADILPALESVGQDVRYALRTLRQAPGMAAVALFSLALAIGANTAIFSIVNAALLRALPYRDSGRMAILWTTNALNGSVEQNTSVPNLADWNARNHVFQDLAAYREAEGPVLADDPSTEPEWARYAWVTENFFDTLGRLPALGRLPRPAEFRGLDRVAVVSDRLWRSRFGGSPGVLGRTLTISGLECAIVGVMPPDFRFPTSGADLWLPAGLSWQWQQSRVNRASRFGAVFGALRPGIAFDRARAEMRAIAESLEREHPQENQNLGVNVVPLYVQVNGKSVAFTLAVLFAAVVVVLMIACANVTNLLLARGVARGREIALRAALGAGRARIARQLLTESVLLAFLAGVLSLPVAAWSMRAFLALAPRDIARLEEARIDPGVLLFSFLASLASGALFGLAPAIRLSRGACSGRNAAAAHSTRPLRAAFLVSQIALAVVLLFSAGLLVRSLLAVQSVDAGFGNLQVLTASLRFDNAKPRANRVRLCREAIGRIRRLPGVRSAGAIGSMFWEHGAGKFGLREVEGRPPDPRDQWTALTWTSVAGDYFQTLGVPLLRGRWFSDRDREDTPPVVMINQTMARRYWPAEDPIGKRIKGFDARGKKDDWVTVVGVVRDVRSGGLERIPMAQIFEAQAQSLDATDTLVVSAESVPGLAAAIRGAIRGLDRTAVLTDISTVERRLDAMNTGRRFQTEMLAGFAALALALAAAGIFGAMHYSVTQRTQEIGIRMALGARRRAVLKMVLREGLTLAAAGIGLGAIGAVAAGRAISGLLFGVTPQDPATFAAVLAMLAFVALAGCAVPARRATRVDPMVAIRCD